MMVRAGVPTADGVCLGSKKEHWVRGIFLLQKEL